MHISYAVTVSCRFELSLARSTLRGPPPRALVRSVSCGGVDGGNRVWWSAAVTLDALQALVDPLSYSSGILVFIACQAVFCNVFIVHAQTFIVIFCCFSQGVLSHCPSTRCLSTATHSEDGNLIYTGSLGSAVRGESLASCYKHRNIVVFLF